MKQWLGKLFQHQNLCALFCLLIVTVAIYNPFFFQGLIPFPGNLLVSFHFPWDAGGFAGYNSWTTHKEVIAADAIRQIYPWRHLVIEQIKSGHLPLWNPYNFSGTPLLANLQSSVFFPGNLVFFVLPFVWAWVGLVIFLPMVFAFGTYLFLRSLKLSFFPALLGGIIAMNVSIFSLWQEQLIHMQSYLFLPFILLAVNIAADKKQWRFLLVIPFLIAFAFFGGHAQSVAYLCLLSFLFMVFKRIPLLWMVPVFALGIGVAAVQLLPTAELYFHSAREVSQTMALFPKTILPPSSFISLLAADFFGNPATNNYFGPDYANDQINFGVIAVVLGLTGVLLAWKKPSVKFFALVALLAALFSATPLAFLWPLLKVPILSSSNASRIFFLTEFSFAVLSAFALETLLQEKVSFKKVAMVAAFFILCYATLVLSTSLLAPIESAIARKNLILPIITAIIALLSVTILAYKNSSRKFIALALVLIFSGAVFEYTYFFNKYQPFSPLEFTFPAHPVFNFLRDTAGVNRFYGFGSAHIDTNFATEYQVFAPEGYDSLYIKRYGELLDSSDTASLPADLLRSDAMVGKNDNVARNRLFDLLGVKYIIDKDDSVRQKPWQLDVLKYPTDRYQRVWRDYVFFAYQRLSAQPRAQLFFNFEVLSDNRQQLQRFYQNSFDPKRTLILDHAPPVSLDLKASGTATITSYQPNQIVVDTKAPTASLLFLSDVNYPGWQAVIDGKASEIFQADYVFRSVLVPAGEHQVVFSYEPLSFKLGLGISLLTAISTGAFFIFKSYGYKIKK